MVSAHREKAACLTRNGEVYTLGYGWEGKLDHQDLANQDSPTIVEALYLL